MEQNDFRRILSKYLRGEALPEERKMIDAWYASMGKDTDDLGGAPEESASDDFGWANVYAHVKKSRIKDKQRKLLPWYLAGIAASLITMIVSLIFLVSDNSDDFPRTKANEPSQTWKNFVNTTNLTQVIVLPDSSKVAIEPESKLKFSSLFNKTKREVYLEGEAFFHVTHNARVPFFVHANEVTTKVLGTSFIIKAIKYEREITVVVKTGKVSVFASPKKEEDSLAVKEIILTPNQQITYDKEEKEISKTLVKKPQAILPAEEVRRMRFEEAPLTEIFKALEKLYGVEIDFDEALFSACRLTTVISKDDLYGRLDIICNVIGTSYTLHEDRIVIRGAGCKTKMH
jgi:transmembrane sensor